MTGSLAYRTNAAAIKAGDAPAKYTRILPFVTGRNVLEIGSAEGVLALLMAERGHVVTAIEKSAERHAEAHRLKAKWLAMGRDVVSCAMVRGDVMGIDPAGYETIVAVRSLYYLRDRAIETIARFRDAKSVVLCGNRNRALRWRTDTLASDDGLGQWNRLASIEGMSEVLRLSGFRVDTVIEDGDPIVVGRR